MEQHGLCAAVSCCTTTSSERSILTQIEALSSPEINNAIFIFQQVCNQH